MNYQSFEQLLKINKTTVYRVSKNTGIAASTFTDWKQGRSTPKADKLAKLAAYFGVSIDYFVDGAGTRIPSYGIKLPIIGEIRAGSPIITDESLLGYEWADISDGEEYFFLKIRGDSMKNIGMVEDSLVLFKKQTYADEGDIVACLVEGDSATVKRFHKEKKGVLLIPENEDYKPIPVSPEAFETGEARILGVAVEIKIKL